MWIPGLVLVTAAAVACSGPTTVPADESSLVPELPPAAIVTDAEDALGAAATDAPAGDAVDVPRAEPADADVADEPGAEPVAAVAVLTATQTYVDDVIGYAIDYPAHWSEDATPGSIVTLTSFDPVTRGHGGLVGAETKVDIVPDLAQSQSNLSELAAMSATVGQVTRREEVQLAGGVPAVYLRLTSAALGGETEFLVAVINGRGLRVQGYGDLTLFSAIARTLRPAP